MVRTTSQTFLGLTLGCARCHNHKFDPLTMVDYYSLAAILAPLKRPNKGRIDRDVPLGTPEQIAAINARNEELAKLDAKILRDHHAKAGGRRASRWPTIRRPAARAAGQDAGHAGGLSLLRRQPGSAADLPAAFRPGEQSRARSCSRECRPCLTVAATARFPIPPRPLTALSPRCAG